MPNAPRRPCACSDALAPTSGFARSALGSDRLFGEVSRDICVLCGRAWLHYFLTFEGFTGSGRWCRLPLDDGQQLSAESALAALAASPGYIAGGSFFGGIAHWRHGPLDTHEHPTCPPPFQRSASKTTPSHEPVLPPHLRAVVQQHDDGDPHLAPHVACTADGTHWAFTTRRVATSSTTVWVDGEHLTDIPGSAVQCCPAWSADGRHLALHMVHLEEQRSAIVVLRDMAGEGEVVYQSELLDACVSPAWHPSGNAMALLRTRSPSHPFTRSGPAELALLDLASGCHWPLCAPGGCTVPPGGPQWLDTRRIACGDDVFTLSAEAISP